MSDNFDTESFIMDNRETLPVYLRENTNGPYYFQEQAFNPTEREKFEKILEAALDEKSLDISFVRRAGSEHGELMPECKEEFDRECRRYEDWDEFKRWDEEYEEPPRTVVELATNELAQELRYEDHRMHADGSKGFKQFTENDAPYELVSAIQEQFPATVNYTQSSTSF